jgi:hypothetical protein
MRLLIRWLWCAQAVAAKVAKRDIGRVGGPYEVAARQPRLLPSLLSRLLLLQVNVRLLLQLHAVLKENLEDFRRFNGIDAAGDRTGLVLALRKLVELVYGRGFQVIAALC